VSAEVRVLTQMYGPAARCKRFSSICRLRSCINVSGLWLEHLLRAIMDISARAFSLADRPRPCHSGHQCSHAPGRPILHLYLASRRPRLETVCCYVIAYLAVPLFEPRAVPSSRPAERRSRRAQGWSRPAVALGLAAGSGVVRPRLDHPEHGARIKRVGRRLHRRSSSARRRVL
jgi:hypothetical protein